MIYKGKSSILSTYYLTTIIDNPMKEKGLSCSRAINRLVATKLLHYYDVVTTKIKYTTNILLNINKINTTLFVVSKTPKKLNKIMTLEEIKNISIRAYLEQMGITPAKEYSSYAMYHSLFREDRTPSLKVDYKDNIWYDFGLGKGGSIIDLHMNLNNYSTEEAIADLDKYDTTTQPQINSFSFHRNKIDKEPAIRINEVKPITHPALIQYLNERCITPDLANQYCKEVHYSINNRPYFAIGFQNNSGSWAFRNKGYKGCSAMDIKTFFNNNETCLVFEGFMDFLSYLTMKGENKPKHDAVVLNSTVNLPKVINKLSNYQTIQAFLDNDEGGRRAVHDLHSTCKEVIDQSVHYRNFNDLNDFHRSRSDNPKRDVAVQIKRPNRGRKL